MSFRGSPVRRHAEILAGDEARIKKKCTHRHTNMTTGAQTQTRSCHLLSEWLNYLMKLTH